jgi:hypothetical protein
VVGPISGQDFSVLRYLAGYSPWIDSPNYLGHLEYLDLYDATIEPSEWYAAYDKNAVTNHSSVVKEANELPYYAFLKAYSLKTLILPKTLKTIHSRSMLECEYLETVVLGDSTTYINWDAFDDCAAMTRMYILAKKKPEMTQDNWLWRNLCNNYNPTFDAFYVRPSLYEEYVADRAYTGSWFQRTSNISKGAFNDDESFAAFAAHAAATEDDLIGVTNIDGWFAGRTGIKNLIPLRYTQVDTLKAAEIQPLTQLEKIALPMSLVTIEDDAFSNAKNLRYADFLKPDGVAVINDYEMASSSIAAGLCEYPEGCLEAMQKHYRCLVLNAEKIAEDLGNAKCMNIVLFGGMVKALHMDDIDWEAVIAETVPAKFKEPNLKAYRAGYDAV